MDDHTPDEALPCADARRVLLLTMRNVRSVSDQIGNLVAPWGIIDQGNSFSFPSPP